MEHQNFYCFEQLSIQPPVPLLELISAAAPGSIQFQADASLKDEFPPLAVSAIQPWGQPRSIGHKLGFALWWLASSELNIWSGMAVYQEQSVCYTAVYRGSNTLPLISWSSFWFTDASRSPSVLWWQKWYLPHKDTLGRCPLSVFSGLPGGSLGSRGLYEIDPGSVFDPRSSIDRISSALLPPLPPIHTQESLREDELQVGKYSLAFSWFVFFFAGPKECTSWRTRIGT